RFEVRTYYRCEGRLKSDPAESFIVYAAAIPKAWEAADAVVPAEGYRASFSGMFLKMGPPNQPVFVAQRAAWFQQTLLGQLEMDAGLFDGVKNRTPIQVEEGETFYQMLAAVG